MADPLLGVTEDDLSVERDVVISEYREVVVVVGDRDTLLPQLRKAGLEPEVVEPAW